MSVMIFDFDNPPQPDVDIDSHFENVTSSKAWGMIAKEQYDLDYKEEYQRHREYRKQKEVIECGDWRITVSPYTGRLGHYRYACKHYKECSKCSLKRIGLEVEKANDYLGCQVVIGSQQEVKEMLKSYSKEEYSLKPLTDGRSMVILAESSIIGEEFTHDHIEMIRDEFQPFGRRTSGNLKVKTNEPSEDKGEVGVITYRDMKVEFDPDKPDSPQDISELDKAMQKECKLDEVPETLDQVQYSMVVVEQTVKKICDHYGLKFNFYTQKKRCIELNKVDWQWLKDKLLVG